MAPQEPLPLWPALAGLPHPLPVEIRCERGVLGKEPGGDADFHWIAASPGFSGPTSDLARRLGLGSEDVARTTMLWRSDARLHQAIRCYPGRSPDAHGRAFLEKQVLEWQRPADLPAALGALILLPLAATLDDSVWQGLPRDPFADRLFVALTEGDLPRLAPDPAALVRTIREGTAELRARFREQDLGALYARLLAGDRAVFPLRTIDPLGPSGLAALLLPLPREIADRISMVAWLPSSLAEQDRLAPHWDLILGNDLANQPKAAAETQPGPELQARGLALAQSIFRDDPSPPVPQSTQSGRVATAVSQPSAATAKLTLWGPSGSGKTVFLGQLYWQLNQSDDSEWDLYPGESGLDFFEMLRDRIYSANAFPPGTQVGTTLNIVCHLRHRKTQELVTLALEDRAGEDYEGLHQEVLDRLLQADGIVLLLDPLRRDDKVFSEVSHTFDRLLVAFGTASGAQTGRFAQKDTRPVAVCVTKADELIETPEDYRLALSEPDAFARQHVDRRLLGYLESRFARFALFPVSAAGVRLQHGAIEPVVFYDETLRPRINSGRPFNLLAPIDWLIRQAQQ